MQRIKKTCFLEEHVFFVFYINSLNRITIYSQPLLINLRRIYHRQPYNKQKYHYRGYNCQPHTRFNWRLMFSMFVHCDKSSFSYNNQLLHLVYLHPITRRSVSICERQRSCDSSSSSSSAKSVICNTILSVISLVSIRISK